MSYSSEDATKAWALTPEQEQAVREFTGDPHALGDMIKQFGIENGKIRQMPEAGWNALVDVPQPTPAAASEIKTVTIDGKVVEGTQEFIDAAMRAAFAQHQNDAPARDRNGRYTAEPAKDTPLSDAAAQRAADHATAELAWKRGELNTEEYLAKTGALDNYLASRGLDLNAQHQQAQTNAEEISSWQQATEKFKQNNPDWPGGERLMAAMAEKLESLHLTNNPSVESLERCYAALDIEASLNKTTDLREIAELAERWRIEVEGRSGMPDYRR